MLLGIAILLRSFLRCSLSLSFYEYYARQSENVTYTPTSFLFRTFSALSSPISALAFARYYLRDGFSIVEAPNEPGEIRRDFPFFQHFRFCLLI